MIMQNIEINVWNRLAKLSWMPFEEARAFVHSLKLKNQTEWRIYTKTEKKPYDIPSDPYKAYANSGWKSCR